MTVPRRVAVIGGGISGLAAAHRLTELGRETGEPIDVRLFEAGPRAGGVIQTERTDGFVIEAGPDSFLSEKPVVTTTDSGGRSWSLSGRAPSGASRRVRGTAER